jgi:[ribosomal protein S5]-alanine N-acetyltransferase
MIMETERLILREPEEKDADDLIENANNLNISKYLLTVPCPYTKEDALFFINKNIEKAKESPRKKYQFVIEFKENNKVIGTIGLSKVDEFQGTTTIGYWIGEKYWRKGYMIEAIKKIIEFTFQELNLRRINASVYTENTASNEILKKLGFRHEGIKRKNKRTKSTGDIHDENIYGLLKEEWK